MDASLLLLSWYGFEPADSPRSKSTYQRITEKLRAGPALLYRYPPHPPEGAFALCGFWEVEHLIAAGQLEQAQANFERLLTYANDVGLFAEEIAPDTAEPQGNFPQAYTHVGLISAAIALEKARTRERSSPPAEEAV